MSTIDVILLCFAYPIVGSACALGLIDTIKRIFGRRAVWAVIVIVLLWPFTPALALWYELRDEPEDKR